MKAFQFQSKKKSPVPKKSKMKKTFLFLEELVGGLGKKVHGGGVGNKERFDLVCFGGLINGRRQGPKKKWCHPRNPVGWGGDKHL